MTGTGRSCEFGCVSAVLGIRRRNGPAVRFFEVVTVLTQAKAVHRACCPARAVGLGVISVTNRCVAVGRAASLIAQTDEFGQTLGKHSGSRLECHQSTGGGRGVEAAQRGLGPLIRDSFGDELSG